MEHLDFKLRYLAKMYKNNEVFGIEVRKLVNELKLEDTRTVLDDQLDMAYNQFSAIKNEKK